MNVTRSVTRTNILSVRTDTLTIVTVGEKLVPRVSNSLNGFRYVDRSPSVS